MENGRVTAARSVNVIVPRMHRVIRHRSKDDGRLAREQGREVAGAGAYVISPIRGAARRPTDWLYNSHAIAHYISRPKRVVCFPKPAVSQVFMRGVGPYRGRHDERAEFGIRDRAGSSGRVAGISPHRSRIHPSTLADGGASPSVISGFFRRSRPARLPGRSCPPRCRPTPDCSPPPPHR